MPPQRHLPPSMGPRVRQRSSKACAPCRKRKIKCDGTEPCAACTGYGYDCLYVEAPPRKVEPQAQKVAETPNRSTLVSNGTAVLQARPGAIAAIDPASTPSNDAGVYMAAETEVADPSYLHQSLKTRFTSAYSAIAAPRRLGISLGLPNPPRLQSFGWNPGIRPEPKVVPQKSICDMMSLEDMRHFARVYFNHVHQYFGILDRDIFAARATDFYVQQTRGTDFEAVICAVIALGSIFSTNGPFQGEAEVVEQGRVLLDLSIAHAPALLSMKHVQAWVLRSLYLRLTTRPHLSWIASCTAVHVAESIGLHRQIGEGQTRPRHATPMEIGLRRRTFWVALALNQFFASEYGRIRVHIDSIGWDPLQPQPETGDFTAEAVSILQSVPKQQNVAAVSELLELLARTTAIPAKSPFLGVLKADACFCSFRMLHATNMTLPPIQITSILEVIQVALESVTFLCSMQNPWWNVVGTPFHSVCILLSIGTSESLAVVPLALETLKNAVISYDSHLSNEALRTAQTLVQAARDKRLRELASLDRGLVIVGELSPAPTNIYGGSGANTLEWPMDGDLGFMDFLDLGNYYGIEG